MLKCNFIFSALERCCILFVVLCVFKSLQVHSNITVVKLFYIYYHTEKWCSVKCDLFEPSPHSVTYMSEKTDFNSLPPSVSILSVTIATPPVCHQHMPETTDHNNLLTHSQPTQCHHGNNMKSLSSAHLNTYRPFLHSAV